MSDSENITRSLVMALIVSFLLFLVLHVLLWRRYPSNHPRVLWLGTLSSITLAFSQILLWVRSGFRPAAALALVWMEVFLLIAYGLFYSVVARSVTVTLLIQLAHLSTGVAPLESLTQSYLGSSRFDDRLHLMQTSGLVSIRGDNVCLTPSGRRLARLANLFANVLGEGLEG